MLNSLFLKLGSQDKPSFIDAIRDTPASVAEAVICFFAVWSVLGLWGYHTYLICRSVTTNEDVRLKREFRRKESLFSSSIHRSKTRGMPIIVEIWTKIPSLEITHVWTVFMPYADLFRRVSLISEPKSLLMRTQHQQRWLTPLFRRIPANPASITVISKSVAMLASRYLPAPHFLLGSDNCNHSSWFLPTTKFNI